MIFFRHIGLARHFSRYLLLAVAIFCLPSFSLSAGELPLTSEERQWPAGQKTITVGVDSDFALYGWVTLEGVHKGMLTII